MRSQPGPRRTADAQRPGVAGPEAASSDRLSAHVLVSPRASIRPAGTSALLRARIAGRSNSCRRLRAAARSLSDEIRRGTRQVARSLPPKPERPVGVGTPGAPGRACIGTALDLPIAARAEPVKPGETLRVRI